MEKLKYILGWILIFLFNAFSWASGNNSGSGGGVPDIHFDGVGDDTEDGEGKTIGMPGHMEGTQPNVPIDMYEGILIAVAIVLILGYYYYTTQKNKMVKS